MTSVTRILAASLFVVAAGTGRADTIDRINSCQQSGGGTCVFDLLRELASRPSGGRPEIINNGVFMSENYVVTISSYLDTITLTGSAGISEAGVYKCVGSDCKGPTYSFTINSRDQITMSYGRVWIRKQ